MQIKSIFKTNLLPLRYHTTSWEEKHFKIAMNILNEV